MRVSVKGMSCQHCVNSVTKALEQLEGVKNVEVSLEKGEAKYDQDKPVDKDTVRKAVQDAGYDVGEFEE